MNDERLNALPLCMAYIPMQKWQKLYSLPEALKRGTLFEELDLPFVGKEEKRHGTQQDG